MKTLKNSKKGLELPVNMLVLLAIAIIVLLSAVAWFLLTFQGTSTSQARAQQFRDCCSLYVNVGCPAGATGWPGSNVCGTKEDGTSWTLGELGSRIGVDSSSDAPVRRACGCPGVTSGEGGGGDTGGPPVPT